MTLSELQAALTETQCSGDTQVRATLGDAPMVVVDLCLEPHPESDITPPSSVMLRLSPLRP